jgi:hypothetical protein
MVAEGLKHYNFSRHRAIVVHRIRPFHLALRKLYHVTNLASYNLLKDRDHHQGGNELHGERGQTPANAISPVRVDVIPIRNWRVVHTREDEDKLKKNVRILEDIRCMI